MHVVVVPLSLKFQASSLYGLGRVLIISKLETSVPNKRKNDLELNEVKGT